MGFLPKIATVPAMSDQFTETSRQGWLGRLGNSFVGILIGIILLIASFPLLFWNEGRAVKRYQTLKEGAGIVVSVAADRIDPANEGRLVHVTGQAEAKGTLSDPEFGISVPNGLKLRRKVEMYQWVEERRTETRNKLGGGTEKVTTYHYNKEWSPKVESSKDFREPAGHENPASMPYSSAVQTAAPITLGVFTLPGFFVEKINRYAPLAEVSTELAPEAIRSKVKSADGGLFLGADPKSPAVGDVRITFSAIHPGLISVVGKQAGQTFEKFRAAAGGDLDLLEEGSKSASEMFAAAEQTNKMVTWAMRVGFFLMMTMGLSLIAQPLRVMADVLPIAGRVVGMGIGFFAFLLAGIGSSVTIAIAWISYRPMVGIPVLIVTGVLVVWLVVRLFKSKAKTAPRLADVPPPL